MKPKITKAIRNRRLRRIRDQILAEPRQFDMDLLFDRYPRYIDRVPNCGTTACIAGWACALFSSQRPMSPKAASLRLKDPWARAHALLGLKDGEPARLFSVEDWPQKFINRWWRFQSKPTRRARVAAERIDHFIKTGE